MDWLKKFETFSQEWPWMTFEIELHILKNSIFIMLAFMQNFDYSYLKVDF